MQLLSKTFGMAEQLAISITDSHVEKQYDIIELIQRPTSQLWKLNNIVAFT